MSTLNKLLWEAYAFWKRITSFFKHDWSVDDYPIRVNFHSPGESAKSGNRKTIPWSSFIYSWPGMMGMGNTRQEALEDLNRHFENFKASGRKLSRPGTRVPIEFALTSRIGMHPELKDDFVLRVLDLSWAFLSDKSSLNDFSPEKSNDFLVSKIREVYGVDVSDITSGNLAEIFERISKTKVT